MMSFATELVMMPSVTDVCACVRTPYRGLYMKISLGVYGAIQFSLQLHVS